MIPHRSSPACRPLPAGVSAATPAVPGASARAPGHDRQEPCQGSSPVIRVAGSAARLGCRHMPAAAGHQNDRPDRHYQRQARQPLKVTKSGWSIRLARRRRGGSTSALDAYTPILRVCLIGMLGVKLARN